MSARPGDAAHGSPGEARGGAEEIGVVVEQLRRVIRTTGLRRSHIAAARMYCERQALALMHRGAPSSRAGRILCYHGVGTRAWGVNDVTPMRLRAQIELALRSGHRFTAASEIARGTGRPGDLAITFDDGLRSVGRYAAPVLAEYGIPWTFFVVTSWVDGRHPWDPEIFLNWTEIERLVARGATVGSHSVTHPNFGVLEPERAREELVESRRAIESRLGITTREFAIPMGQARDWCESAQALATEAGYEFVYAQAERSRSAGTVARTFVARFDSDRLFRAALGGAYDNWEEWV